MTMPSRDFGDLLVADWAQAPLVLSRDAGAIVFP